MGLEPAKSCLEESRRESRSPPPTDRAQESAGNSPNCNSNRAQGFFLYSSLAAGIFICKEMLSTPTVCLGSVHCSASPRPHPRPGRFHLLPVSCSTLPISLASRPLLAYLHSILLPVAPEPIEREGKPAVFLLLPGDPPGVSIPPRINPSSTPWFTRPLEYWGLPPALPVCHLPQCSSHPALCQPLHLSSAFSPQGLCMCCRLLPLHRAWRMLGAQ